MSNDPNNLDDFVTRRDLSQAASQAQAERFYFERHPEDARLPKAYLYAVAQELATTDPTLAQKPPAETADLLHKEIRDRLGAGHEAPLTTGDPRLDYRNLESFEPTDAERAEALREEQAAYLRTKSGLKTER